MSVEPPNVPSAELSADLPQSDFRTDGGGMPLSSEERKPCQGGEPIRITFLIGAASLERDAGRGLSDFHAEPGRPQAGLPEYRSAV